MTESRPSEKTAFLRALDIASESERRAYLDQVCGDDAPLRAQLEALLLAHERPQGLLDSPSAAPTTNATQSERPGTQIGPYKLLQVIGEGGMGLVYMAEQMKPVERRVALKIIKPGMDTRHIIARFEAERQALAMMDHPNIAKVLDAGMTESGRPFFAMELVKGVPITKYCDQKQMPLTERLELFIPVCQAIQHAHQKGIIHRDVKPSNILIALYDGRPVPKVIDFGVAKATARKLTERTMFTEYGQVVGTLEYMSPEQAELNQLDIDTRSDIYSLGVLLYELLTGATPFDPKRLRSAAFDEMLRIIREEEPPKPSTKLSSGNSLPTIATNRHTEPARLRKAVRGELDWIVMKALEKDRNRRYETANGLAMDLQRYLRDEHVLACPPSAAYRFRKFARRNRLALGTCLAVVLGLIVLAAGVASYAWQQRQLATDRSKLALEKEQARLETEAKLYRALVGRASALRIAREPGYRGDVWENLRQAAALNTPQKNPDDIRSEVLACLGDPIGMNAVEQSAAKRRRPTEIPAAFAELLKSEAHNAKASSANGELFAVGNVTLSLLDRRRKLSKTTHSPVASLHVLVFTADNKFLIGGGDEGVAVWTVPSLELWTFSRLGNVHSVDVHPSGNWMVVSSGPRTFGQQAELWSLTSNRLIASLKLPPKAERFEFSADGQFLLAISGPTVISARMIMATPEKRYLEGHRRSVPAVAFSPDGTRLASVSKDERVGIWDVGSGALLHWCAGHNGPVQSVAFNSDGTLLATGDLIDKVVVWDTKTGKPLAQVDLRRMSVGIWRVAFAADDRILAAAGGGGIVLWRVHRVDNTLGLEMFAKINVSDPSAHYIYDFAMHPHGTHLAWLDRSQRIHTYDLLRSDEPNFQVKGRVSVFAIQFDSSGDYLRYSAADGGLATLDWRRGTTVAVTQHKFSNPLFQISPDDRWVASPKQSQLTIYDLHTHKSVLELPPETANIFCAAWSPDGTRVAVALADGSMAIWNLEAVREQLAEFAISVPSTRVANGTKKLPALSEGQLEQIIAKGKLRIRADGQAALAEVDGSHWKQAIASNRDMLRIDPQDAGARNRLANLLNGGARALVERDDSTGRDAARAVLLAAEAVELAPQVLAFWNTLGVANYRAGNFSDAIPALEKSMQVRSSRDTLTWFVLAMAHWQLGNHEEGRKWFEQAAQSVNKPYGHEEIFQRMFLEAGSLLGAEDDPRLSLARGRLDLLHSRWNQAADEYARATEAYPPSDSWFEHACVRLIVDDLGGYRRCCEALVSEIDPPKDPQMAYILARSCSLAPERIVEPIRLVEWALAADASRPKTGWYLHALGLAYYRAGQFEQSIKQLQASQDTGWRNSLNAFLLAMAYYRLNHEQEAEKWWNTAQKELAEYLPQTPDEPVRMPAPDWAEVQVLRREATSLLGKDQKK